MKSKFWLGFASLAASIVWLAWQLGKKSAEKKPRGPAGMTAEETEDLLLAKNLIERTRAELQAARDRGIPVNPTRIPSVERRAAHISHLPPLDPRAAEAALALSGERLNWEYMRPGEGEGDTLVEKWKSLLDGLPARTPGDQRIRRTTALLLENQARWLAAQPPTPPRE